jgi:hypothetical protein
VKTQKQKDHSMPGTPMVLKLPLFSRHPSGESGSDGLSL